MKADRSRSEALSALPPEFYPAPRSVKPRSRQYETLPVIAVSGDEVLTEDGELWTLAELVQRLPKLPPILFVTVGAADLFSYFDAAYASNPSWQARLSDHQRTVPKSHPDRRVRRAGRVTIAVHWFGFKSGPRSYHRMIDPITMYQDGIRKICPGDDPEIIRLLRWAVILRDFCAENNLEVRPTMGGISSQLLTDSRFYPNARRKVPVKTNERAREWLPGNYYKLNVIPSPDRSYTAYELDQHRAHHYHAQRLRFPHADHLYAYGYFRNLSDYYRDKPSPDFMGLYCLDLLPPRFGRAYAWLGVDRQLAYRFVHTNELSHLLDIGYKVLGIRAAWGSHHRDTGLNRVAEWCCEQLDRYDDARWLKPLLLSTYGSLACRATNAEAIFKRAKGGTETLILTGSRSFVGKRVRRPQKLEPGFVNVLQRGMIEAATRSETIGCAQYLEHMGQRVLHVYADALFVEFSDELPLPILPEPWRIKREHTHFCPESMQAYTSDQATKRPGGHAPHDRRMMAVGRPSRLSRLSLVTDKGLK